MAKRYIHIDLANERYKGKNDPRSKHTIQSAINALRYINYSNRFKSADFVNTICEKIKTYAEINFAKAQYDGTNDVRCYFSKNDSKYDVVRKYSDFEGASYRDSNKQLTRDSAYFAERKVVFEGQALYFIEFGTGVHYNLGGSSHPWLHSYGSIKKGVGSIKPIGTYGQGKGKGDAWVYYGEAGTNGSPFNSDPNKILTHGNPPNRCIYNAVQEAIRDSKTTFIKSRRIK